jgi:hypothetical protein
MVFTAGGKYQAINVLPGTYRITAERPREFDAQDFESRTERERNEPSAIGPLFRNIYFRIAPAATSPGTSCSRLSRVYFDIN